MTLVRRYVRLPDRLAARRRVVGPDLPGLDLSDPLPGRCNESACHRSVPA